MFMRFLALALGAALLAGCGDSAPSAARVSAAQTIAGAVLRGKVVDKASGRGIEGATVKLAGGSPGTATAGDGLFALGPIPSRGGQVVVSAEGFASRTLAVPPGAREALRVELARDRQSVAYHLTLAMQAGRLDGTGRVAIAGERLLVTGREGKLGALFNLDRVTGEEYDRFSWASLFTPLPMELADVAAHPKAGTFLLTNSGRVYAFDGRGRFQTSSAVVEGPGAMACDGRHLYIASGKKIRVLDTALAIADERAFEYGDASGFALDDLGNMYISTWEGRVIQLDADFRLIADWRIDGVRRLAGLALDRDGQVLVTDPDARRILVLGTIGQVRSAFGTGDLRAPRGLTVDDHGAVYVGDVSLRAVLRFDRMPGTSAFAAPSLP